MFTLLWAIYLMSCAVLTVFGSRHLATQGLAQHRLGAQAMLVLMLLGTVVLWPATRLSEASPGRPARATLVDLFVLIAPMQAVIWPLPILTRWGVGVAAGLAAMAAAWTVLVSGVVLWCSSSLSVWTRSWGAALCVAIATAGPGVSWLARLSGYDALPGWWGLVSPVTTVGAVVSSPGNMAARVDGGEWLSFAVVGALGLIGLLMAATLRGFGVGGAGSGAGVGAGAIDRGVS